MRHSACQSKFKKHPTRLLDVSASGICLETTFEDDAAYVILSYCWGSNGSLKSTIANLDTFKRTISERDIPKTILDAIQITRRLGFQYLWVDALCIVQDSPEDWSREFPRMVDYYRRAIFTFSAQQPTSCHDGIFKTRSLKSVQISKEYHIRPCSMDQSSDKWGSGAITGPLSTRAWTLQERMLSNRILYYSEKEILWECQSSAHREGSTKDYMSYIKGSQHYRSASLRPRSTVSMLRDDTILSRNEDSLKEGLDTWYELVSEYTGRSLTRASDKLPAISSLASLML
jgi:hypothetical protein